MYKRRTSGRGENPATTPEDISLYFALQSWETGISYYGLSKRVSSATWKSIADHFTFINGNSEECEEDEVEGLYGWYTMNPKTVEKILGVKPEYTIEAQKERAKQKAAEDKAKLDALTAKYHRISELFSSKEYPDPMKEQPVEAAKYMPGFEKMRVSGEDIDDPTNPPNIYGGGRWWVIQGDDWIWEMHNNGADGDDWTRNNIRTGGAGAIGYRVPYNQELADLIRSFRKPEQS